MKKIKIFLVQNQAGRFLLVEEPRVNDTVFEVTELEVPKETINSHIINSVSEVVNNVINKDIKKLYIVTDFKSDYDMELKLSKLIVDMDPSTRLLNILKEAELYSLGDVLKLGKTNFKRLRNLGNGTLKEMEELLRLNNLDWEIAL